MKNVARDSKPLCTQKKNNFCSTNTIKIDSGSSNERKEDEENNSWLSHVSAGSQQNEIDQMDADYDQDSKKDTVYSFWVWNSRYLVSSGKTYSRNILIPLEHFVKFGL